VYVKRFVRDLLAALIAQHRFDAIAMDAGFGDRLTLVDDAQLDEEIIATAVTIYLGHCTNPYSLV
jgi:hypothetical protein